MSDTTTKTIPLCVISGTLGCGKTTLLTFTEKNERRLGRRPVVIAQAVGAAATDAGWLRANGANVIEIADETELPSGSAWRDAFVEALRMEPDAVFVETVAQRSGAAAARLTADLTAAAAEAGFSAPRFVMVVDAGVGELSADRLALAMEIVFAKAERCPPEVLAELQTRCTQAFPGITQHIARNGRVATAGEWWRGDVAPTGGASAGESAPETGLAGYFLPATRSLTRETFTAFLDGLPDGVLVAKGYVEFVDEGGAWSVRRENGATVIRPVDTKFPLPKHIGLVVRTDAGIVRDTLAAALTACEAGRRRLVVL
jgi:G3E family GTPase